MRDFVVPKRRKYICESRKIDGLGTKNIELLLSGLEFIRCTDCSILLFVKYLSAQICAINRK